MSDRSKLRTRLPRTGLVASLLAGTLAAAATAASLVPGAQDKADIKVDFPALAQRVVERAGLTDVPPEELNVEHLMESSFLTLRLGIYDLCLSKHSSLDKNKAGNLVELAAALLDTQSAFLDWLGPKAPGIKEAKKDIKTLKGWLKNVRGDVIAKLDEEELGELTALLGAKSKVLEAQERFGKYMASGAPLGLEREGELVEPFVLAPDRREFLELLASFGLLYPDQQYIYWDNNVLDWTNTHCNNVSLVALEFAELGSSTSGAFGGISMNSRTATGMAQQIAQLAAGAMIDNLYGSKIPASLAGAFSVNLVVDIFGECNTRVDGDLKARRTEARSVFVPGGRSEGGTLPPLMADSRWRGEHGADRYLVGLQASQAAGTSEAKTKAERTHVFQLQNDKETKRMTIQAPFLGTGAAARDLTLPDSFFGDAQEMFRSYRTGFTYWLQTAAKDSKRGAKSTFAELLTKLAQAEPTDDALEVILQELYGKPLSAEVPDKKDLEGTFLEWLARN